MSMSVRILLLCLAILLAQEAKARDICLGTFSNFRFNNEAGDIQGVEIKIVYTKIGRQAAVQFSEGEPDPIVVIPVTCDGTKIFLKIPKDGGRSPAKFEGIVSKDRLDGELSYESGGSQKLRLPRKKGYWD